MTRIVRSLIAATEIALCATPALAREYRDEGYRGEIRVILLNTDTESSFEVALGDRIAQLVVVRVETPDIAEVADVSDTERAERGFGSSGQD